VLLAAHQGETSDDVAQILYMKATLYIQIIGDKEKGVTSSNSYRLIFPQSRQRSRWTAW